MDVSDIFYFFLFRGGGEREEASEEVAGGPVFYYKYREGGGGSEEDAQEGEGRQGEYLWGGGKYFFRAAEIPTKKGARKHTRKTDFGTPMIQVLVSGLPTFSGNI